MWLSKLPRSLLFNFELSTLTFILVGLNLQIMIDLKLQKTLTFLNQT